MNTNEAFRDKWRRIEKQAIYLILFIFVLANWVAVFLPSVRSLFSTNVGTALFATLLLAIFRLFEQRLGKLSVESYGQTFYAATDSVLATGASARTVDLFSHTSHKYYSVICNKDVHIKRMRLLVAAIDPLSGGPSLVGNEKDKKSLKAERDFALRQWIQLRNKGIIDVLEVHEYAFMSQFHFMVVDGDSAQFGFYQLPHDTTGTRVPRNFALHPGSVGSELVDDFNSLFEAVFARYSTPVELETHLSLTQ